jgi:hypothetical protein
LQESSTVRQQDVRVDPVAVFRLRCNARARLYATGEIIDSHTAVDELQISAEASGLIAAIGQDRVQAIISAAFSAVPSAADSLPDDQYDTFAALCDAADEKQRRKPQDSRTERARALMADDVSLERAIAELNKRAPGDVPIATLQAAEYLALQQNDLQRLKDWLAPRSLEDVAAIRKHLSKRGPSCQ